jgi:hypothetical protein
MAFTSSTANEAITSPMTMIGYVSAASTSARTYKVRFTSTSSFRTAEILNAQLTGQMYAIEVSA